MVVVMVLAASICVGDIGWQWRVLFSSLYNLLGAKVYIGYDYVHIDNLTDISAYQNTMYSKYTVLIFTSNLALCFSHKEM